MKKEVHGYEELIDSFTNLPDAVEECHIETFRTLFWDAFKGINTTEAVLAERVNKWIQHFAGSVTQSVRLVDDQGETVCVIPPMADTEAISINPSALSRYAAMSRSNHFVSQAAAELALATQGSITAADNDITRKKWEAVYLAMGEPLPSTEENGGDVDMEWS